MESRIAGRYHRGDHRTQPKVQEVPNGQAIMHGGDDLNLRVDRSGAVGAGRLSPLGMNRRQRERGAIFTSR